MDTFENTHNKSSQKEIAIHLYSVDNVFVPSLSTYVDIDDYSLKIFTYAERFEIWKNSDLVSLCAVYYNDVQSKIGYLTNLSVLSNYQKRGLAKMNLDYAIKWGRDNGFDAIKLEVDIDNDAALYLYNSLGFRNGNVVGSKIFKIYDLR